MTTVKSLQLYGIPVQKNKTYKHIPTKSQKRPTKNKICVLSDDLFLFLCCVSIVEFKIPFGNIKNRSSLTLILFKNKIQNENLLLNEKITINFKYVCFKNSIQYNVFVLFFFRCLFWFWCCYLVGIGMRQGSALNNCLTHSCKILLILIAE